MQYLNKWTLLFVLIGILIIYVKFSGKQSINVEKFDPVIESAGEQCSSKKGCKENKNLLPVMDPLFNMREVCKQCILLEDHLFQTKKRCLDCQLKHMLSIEALTEEAITLDKENKFNKILQPLPDKIRSLIKRLNNSSPKEYNNVAQGFRSIRKSLMPICKNAF